MDHEENIEPVPEENGMAGSEEMATGGSAYGDSEGPSTTSRWMVIGLVGFGLLALLAIVAILTGGSLTDQPAPTEPVGGANAFITIVQPGQGAVLPVPESVPIRGQAGGLFENSLVVQAFDSEGTLLAEEPTTVDAGEPGGTGNWEVNMVIPVKPGTSGLIFASSTSPVDGSVIASASVEVVYGEEVQAGSEIKIDQPKDGDVLDTNLPVTVSGTGRGLFENNVVVEILDSSGTVIVQEPTTMQTEEVGGAGTWSIELRIPASEGEKGTVHAFSTSPQDGSIDAEDQVGVQFGEETAPVPTAAPTAEPPPDTGAGIEDLLWSLKSLGGAELVPGSAITMDLTEGTSSGTAGCNTYSGPYEISGTSISFGLMATTRAACLEPPGLMEQESQYLAELQMIEEYHIDSDGLQMFGSASPVTLFYDSVVMGTVGFMNPIEIPAGSTLTVQLQDSSLQDVAAKVLGESVITDFSVIPIPFTVSYDPTQIDTRFTYSISARITDEAGNLIFINTTAYNVITNGNPSVVEVIVEPV